MKTRIEKVLNCSSKYCYDNGVIINKLGITNQEELDQAEAGLSYLRLCKLCNSVNNFKFDYEYYLSIHEYLFQDIYHFAGEVRSENIYKSFPFCRPEFVVQYLKSLLDEMSKKFKLIKTREQYIEYLSYYYSEMNLVHPFREGNGRTQREYFRQLVEYLNYHLSLPNMYLDYSLIDEETKDNLINGCIESIVSDDLTLLRNFFDTILKEKDIDFRKSYKM